MQAAEPLDALIAPLSEPETSQPWQGAQWIAAPLSDPWPDPAPAPYFRKAFTLDRPVNSACLTITALGLHEAELNGRRIDDHVFDQRGSSSS